MTKLSSDSSDSNGSCDSSNSSEKIRKKILVLKTVTKPKTTFVTKPNTQTVTNSNTNCDKTQKLELWQNSKTNICDKTQKFKL